MIILDSETYIKEIEADGIKASDKIAEQKIRDYMSHLYTNKTYKKSVIIERTKKIAADYFSALPDEIVNKQLATVYDRIKSAPKSEPEPTKTIALYESEMRTIAELENDKLMRLAFAALIIHKYQGLYTVDENKQLTYKAVAARESDVYKIGDLSSLSGVARDKLWNQLCQAGLVMWYAKTNSAYRFNRKWLAIPMMSVTFNVDIKKDKTGEKVFTRIDDYNDILLYLYLWLDQHTKFRRDDNRIIQCSNCGRPIIMKKKSKCLCEKCANEKNKINEKMRYQRKTA